VPPIGAQGLNLGLRDAATIAEIAADALRTGRDPGGASALGEYVSRRRLDVAARGTAIDLMNRSVLSPFLPAQALRGGGLFLLSRIGPLRRAAMRAGMEGAGNEPRVMRGEVL
jgi:2-octaprenyl-6-methoxyphenol hydroxylase